MLTGRTCVETQSEDKFCAMMTAGQIMGTGRRLRGASGVVAIAALVLTGLGISACGSSSATPSSSSTPGVVNAIGAENEYADVLSQIGGKYVHVSSILNNPNTDPHTFESTPSVAQEVSAAQLIVQNGVGYDPFMNTIESASPDAKPQDHRRPARAESADRHPQPPPLVRPEDDAGGGQGHGQGPLRAPARPRRVLPGQPDHLRRIACVPLAHRHRRVQGALPRHARGRHRAGRRLPAPGHGHEHPHPVPFPGRHHERRRPESRGHHPGERILHQASGQGLRLQPTGGRRPDHLDPRRPP